MIAHIVLFKPKADLSEDQRGRFLDAMREAHASIPQIRRFVVGTRVQTGRPYAALARQFPFFAMLEFDAREDHEAYLTHPAHERLSLGFYQASEAAEAYDFDVAEMPHALASL